MKKALLGTIGLLAVGMAAPAMAADLAARPYTKAPPPIVAPIYDWTGFYIGANGGWGSSHKCWDVTNFLYTRSPAFRRRLSQCDRRNDWWSDRIPLAGQQLGVRFGSAGQLG